MALISLTLNGFYEYDNDLFDNLTFPEGIDRDLAIDTIMERAGSFETIFTDYDYLKYSLGQWGKRNWRTFEKWVNALSIEYNPLHNYDRYEFSSDDGTLGEKSNMSRSATSNSDTEIHNNVSAYDSSGYSPQNEELSGTNSGESESNNSTHDASTSNNHKAHLYGNIGVTTSQQMLRDEIDIARFNLYDEIAQLFIRDLCVAVY